MDTKLEYCVAIRTLGTAGEKYQTLLNSLQSQTIAPKKILVYIPYGYPAPKETIGIEQLVRCEKGMVTQRSLPFDEIDTEYVLFCDDDLYLPPNYVEKMFEGLLQMSGDCIAADAYQNNNMSLWEKVAIFLHSFVTPRKDDGWSVKIKRNASYSYNNHPSKSILRTESAPFASLLCSMTAYRAIHFEDERWMEKFSFAAGDDTLFYYKIHIMGYHVLMHEGTGLKHLDAQAGIRPNIEKKMYYHKMLLFIMWYRIVYQIRPQRKSTNWSSMWEKLRCISAFGWRCLFGVITLPLEVFHYKQPRFFIDYFRGLWAGWKYVRSEEYQRIPAFDAYANQ